MKVQLRFYINFLHFELHLIFIHLKRKKLHVILNNFQGTTHDAAVDGSGENGDFPCLLLLHPFSPSCNQI